MGGLSPREVESLGHPIDCNSTKDPTSDTLVNPTDSLEKTRSHIDPQDNGHTNDPPDGGYGWVCVACVFLINAHTWGVNSVGFLHSRVLVVNAG